jgi:hypothetical protein
MESTDRNQPGLYAEASAKGKTVKELRAEFQADFSQTAISGDDSDCLSSEEILALQSGAELEPLALEHLNRCRVCSSLRKAIAVDPIRKDQFLEAVRRTQTVAARVGQSRQRAALDWRLPVAVLTALSAIAMVLLVPKPLNTGLQEAETSPPGSAGQSGGRGMVTMPIPSHPIEIIVKRPSEPPSVTRVVAKQGTQITVRDYAPQVAAAVVLSQSKITAPIDSPPEVVAEARQKTDDIVQAWLQSDDSLTSTSMPDFSYVAESKSFQLMVGDAMASVPESALNEGLKVKRMVLSMPATAAKALPQTFFRTFFVAKNSEWKLNDGSTITIRRTDDRRTGNSLYVFGLQFERGLGVPQDYNAARRSFELSAQAGNGDAMFELGNFYAEGRGVRIDLVKAREWYLKAAAAGNAQAMVRLGALYERGLGVSRDTGKAHEWYGMAAAAR